MLLALICLLVQLFGDSEWLRYERSVLPTPDVWRFLTANFIHLGWSHWFLNMAGLALVYLLVGTQFSTPQWFAIIVISSLGVSVGLFALNPSLNWYVGFSGALHGLLLAGAVAEIVHQRGRERWFGGILLLCVAAKLVWEQIVGALPGSADMAGGPVVVDSHLYGAIAGLVAGFVISAMPNKRGSTG